jgi:hypothetical protein
VGKVQKCLLYGMWYLVTTMVHFPREVQFTVASNGKRNYYNVLASMVNINFTINSSEFLICSVAFATMWLTSVTVKKTFGSSEM